MANMQADEKDIQTYVMSAINDKSISEAVEEAVPIKMNILDERGVLKDIKANFVMTMIQGNPKVAAALKKQPKNRSDEERDLIKKTRVDAGKRFAFCKKALDNSSDIPYAERLIFKLTKTIQLLRYIGDNSFDEALAMYGAEINIKPLEDLNPEYFKNPDIKTALKYTLEESIKHDNNVEFLKNDMTSKFIDKTNGSYVKDKDNPNGLDSTQFKKLVDAEYFAKTDKEKLEKFCNKNIPENEGGSVSRRIVAGKLRSI